MRTPTRAQVTRSTHEVPVHFARQDTGEVVVHNVVGHAAPRGRGQTVVRVRVVAAWESAVAASVRLARLAENRFVVDRQLSHERVRLRRGRGQAAVRVDLEIGGRLLQPKLVARKGDDREASAAELLN